MKRFARMLGPAARVVLVVLAGVASMATSRARAPVAYPVATAGWREVMTAADPNYSIDPEGSAVVTDHSTGEQIPHRTWIETPPGGSRVVHVMIAAEPVHGHHYSLAYLASNGAWQRLEHVYVAPGVAVAPATYVAPGGYRYVYYPAQPRFAQPPPGARYPYVYRAW